jgi:hypothetical protein
MPLGEKRLEAGEPGLGRRQFHRELVNREARLSRRRPYGVARWLNEIGVTYDQIKRATTPDMEYHPDA